MGWSAIRRSRLSKPSSRQRECRTDRPYGCLLSRDATDCTGACRKTREAEGGRSRRITPRAADEKFIVHSSLLLQTNLLRDLPAIIHGIVELEEGPEQIPCVLEQVESSKYKLQNENKLGAGCTPQWKRIGRRSTRSRRYAKFPNEPKTLAPICLTLAEATMKSRNWVVSPKLTDFTRVIRRGIQSYTKRTEVL
jgi:hypothetical protein